MSWLSVLAGVAEARFLSASVPDAGLLSGCSPRGKTGSGPAGPGRACRGHSSGPCSSSRAFFSGQRPVSPVPAVDAGIVAGSHIVGSPGAPPAGRAAFHRTSGSGCSRCRGWAFRPWQYAGRELPDDLFPERIREVEDLSTGMPRLESRVERASSTSSRLSSRSGSGRGPASSFWHRASW